MTANQHVISWPNFVQFAQCTATAPAESRRGLVILLATATGRHHQFAAYEICRSGCLARYDPASFRFDAYSGRLAR